LSPGRTGTTLLKNLLVAGGQVAIPPETQVIGLAARRFLFLRFLGWSDLCRLIIALFDSHPDFKSWDTDLTSAYRNSLNCAPAERSLARIIDEVFLCFQTRHFPEAVLWGDQSPIHTLHLQRIVRVFPDGLYLHLVRDSRDAVASMTATGNFNLEDSTTRWISCVGEALKLQKQRKGLRLLQVRYEDLVTSPETTLASICDFCGISYRPRMLDFWKHPANVEKTQKIHQNLAKPLFTESIGAWRKKLSANEAEFVTSRTKTLMRRLGYDL
jgi:hypothetical protein